MKPQYNRGLFGDSAIYLTAVATSAGLSFLLLPILTRHLSTHEYGLVAIFQMFVAGISALLAQGIIGAVNRNYFEQNQSEASHNLFVSTGLSMIVLSSAFLCLMIMPFNGFIKQEFGLPLKWIVIAFTASVAMLIIKIRLGEWQVRKKPIAYCSMEILLGLSNLLLSLILVVFLEMGFSGRVIGFTLSAVIFALIALYTLYRKNVFSLGLFNFKCFIAIILFSIPLLPHTVGSFVFVWADRAIIASKISVAEAGIYMVAVQIASILGLLFEGVNKAYSPWLYERLKVGDNHDKLKIVKFSYLAFLILLIIGLCSLMIDKYIVNILIGQEFREAGKILGFIILGQCFTGMYFLVADYIFYAKKTIYLSIVTIASGALNILLIFAFIDNLGITGVAVAYATAMFFRFVMTWGFAQKATKMPWLLDMKAKKAAKL